MNPVLLMRQDALPEMMLVFNGTRFGPNVHLCHPVIDTDVPGARDGFVSWCLDQNEHEDLTEWLLPEQGWEHVPALCLRGQVLEAELSAYDRADRAFELDMIYPETIPGTMEYLRRWELAERNWTHPAEANPDPVYLCIRLMNASYYIRQTVGAPRPLNFPDDAALEGFIPDTSDESHGKSPTLLYLCR